jgi:hypothetical protein
MTATPVTPTAGNASEVVVGGTPVIAVLGGPNGGVITNPQLPTDQGIANSEVLYVNPVGPATLNGNGTTFSLQPGQSWSVIPGQTTQTSVNAATGGHKFSVVNW